MNTKHSTLRPFYLILQIVFAFMLMLGTSLFAQQKKEKFFSMAVLPDVQYYTAQKFNATMKMFYNQIDWITLNAERENVIYVTQLGDITDHGDAKPKEWERAAKAMYRLEKPLSGRPDGVAYGVAVGNHDTRPNGDPNGTKDGYTKYFGREHFKTKSYYGGAYNDSEANENYFHLFNVNGEKFLVLYLAFNDPAKKDLYDATLEESVYDWGVKVLKKYANHKAIIISHSILRPPKSSKSNYKANAGDNTKQGTFTKQGMQIFEKFKNSPNVFLMMSGHISGEALRKEEVDGRTIHVILADYQGRRNPPYEETDRNGGNGIMRLLRFDQDNKTISVRTFTPDDKGGITEEETDDDSRFTISYR